MAANETANRLAASFWFRLEPVADAGAGVATIGFRSLVGCQDRVLIRPSLADGLVFVLFDRELSRRETTLLFNEPYTDHSNPARTTYPVLFSPYAIELFHLDWLGPDVGNPVWFPFDNAAPVPAAYDLDLYNAVCILPTNEARAHDVCVTVLQCAPWQGETTVRATLPAAVVP